MTGLSIVCSRIAIPVEFHRYRFIWQDAWSSAVLSPRLQIEFSGEILLEKIIRDRNQNRICCLHTGFQSKHEDNMCKFNSSCNCGARLVRHIAIVTEIYQHINLTSQHLSDPLIYRFPAPYDDASL